jgi:hypothetical protein
MSGNPDIGICCDCGRLHGRFDPTSVSVGTFWAGECNWCGEIKSVTSPADYGYPTPPEKPLVGDMLDD